MTNQAKLNADVFSKTMQKLTIYPPNIKVAVAVSGGSDSLCLVILAKQWLDTINGELIAIIYDHKLRQESTKEALDVANILKSYNIKSVILSLNTKISVSIQEQARNFRYLALKDYCFQNYIPYLLIGHHLDDQLETMIMRAKKGENIVGEAGMSAKIVDEKVIMLRPLLSFTKVQIQQFLIENNIQWINDPSNNNIKYNRVAIRQDLQKKTHNEIAILKNILHENAILRNNYEDKVLDFLSISVKINYLGLIKIKRTLFIECSEKIQILVLNKLIQFLSGSIYQKRLYKLKNLIDNLGKLDKGKQVVSGNCVFRRKDDLILMYMEKVNFNNFVTSEHKNEKICSICDETYNSLKTQNDFKSYFAKQYFTKNMLRLLPWIYDNKEQKGFIDGKYVAGYFKSKISILNNKFTFN
jgi:tRNA(Ile)-lysidine synthase